MLRGSVFHRESTVASAMSLSERVCMGCLLPDCNDASALCLRAFVTRERTGKAKAAQALAALDSKLERLHHDASAAAALIVLREVRERIRVVAGETGNA